MYPCTDQINFDLRPYFPTYFMNKKWNYRYTGCNVSCFPLVEILINMALITGFDSSKPVQLCASLI